MGEENIAIVGYGTGTAGTDELNEEADRAWREVLADPRAREQAANILGVSSNDLEKRLPVSPFELKTNQAGLGPLELGIIVFAGNVIYDLGKDIAKSSLKAALIVLWQKLLRPRIESRLPLGALGKEAEIHDPKDKKA